MLLFGTACASFGIALTTTSGLGTTPISSVPWTLTAITGLSFGTTTFLINLLFYLIEAVLLGKAMPKWNILQIPAVLVFGIFIDLGMAVAKLIEPTSWPAGLVMSLAGNLWLAVGIVLQKNLLFSGTIRDNLKWGDPDATDDDLWAACRAALADEFLSRMPDGLDTDLGQGGCNV